MKNIPSLTLASGNMGPHATDADYDNWVEFVCEHVESLCGFDVDVDSRRFADGGDDRFCADGSDRDTIRDALNTLWDRWCSEGAP